LAIPFCRPGKDSNVISSVCLLAPNHHRQASSVNGGWVHHDKLTDVGGQPRAAPTRLVFFARGRARLVGCSALFGSPPLPRTALVVLRTPRSASLTASAEGIRAVVLVPNKRALNLYDHEVVPIELANGSRPPVLREG